MRFNGWRRLGVVLASIWLVGGLTVTAIEFSGSRNGIFVYQSIPKGTLVQGDEVTLPNGKANQLDTREPSAGHELNPWEIDWANQPDIPKEAAVRWQRLGLTVVGMPIAIWLLVEVLTLAATWVRRGFTVER